MDISELLKIEDLEDYKVHLATPSSDEVDPLHEFWKNNFEEWQSWQSKKNFERKFILSLIAYGPNEWLFAGIYQSINVKVRDENYYYKTRLTDQAKSLVGRLIISFKREFRQSYPYLENIVKLLVVSEVLKTPSSIRRFPGFKNVSIPFDLLQLIVQNNETSWRTALENVRGIYLITDMNNGKLYVGKASGEYALWSRWEQYINSGHGGNTDLKKLIKVKGYDYAKKYFQFTLLEVTEFNTEESIDKRENYWKEVLKSREFGYNKN